MGPRSGSSRAEEVARHEEQISRPLSQTAHEVGIPLGSEWHVDADLITFPDQFALEIAAHSIQHLKLEVAGRDRALGCVGLDFVD